MLGEHAELNMLFIRVAKYYLAVAIDNIRDRAKQLLKNIIKDILDS